MTETSSSQSALSTMRLAELQALAGQIGLKGISRMRKSELVAAIRDARGASSDDPGPATSHDDQPAADGTARRPRRSPGSQEAGDEPRATGADGAEAAPRSRRRRAQAAAGAPERTP
ncbi:Rho termination factor N-terminal domain-containing protein, partial [Actinomyces slackii]